MKIPQILGLMCTCDPLGFSPTQFFSVPFLVLHKSFIDSKYDSGSNIKEFIEKQVFKLNKDQTSDIITIFENLTIDPMYSTQEHLVSIPMFLSQLYTIHRSKLYEFKGENMELFFKILISELERRTQSQDTHPQRIREICEQYIYPNISKKINKIVNKMLDQYNSENSNCNLKIKKRDQKEIRKANKYEIDCTLKLPCFCENKCILSNGPIKVCSTLIEKVKSKILNNKKWIEKISNPESKIFNLIEEKSTNFFKYYKWLRYYVFYFMGEECDFYKSLETKKFPMSSIEVIAMILQNTQYPK